MEWYWEWLKDFVTGASAHVALVILVAFVAWWRQRVVGILLRTLRRTVRFVTGKPYIVIWTDAGPEVGIRLASEVQSCAPGFQGEVLRGCLGFVPFPPCAECNQSRGAHYNRSDPIL